jgi:hypothetical protein
MCVGWAQYLYTNIGLCEGDPLRDIINLSYICIYNIYVHIYIYKITYSCMQLADGLLDLIKYADACGEDFFQECKRSVRILISS